MHPDHSSLCMLMYVLINHVENSMVQCFRDKVGASQHFCECPNQGCMWEGQLCMLSLRPCCNQVSSRRVIPYQYFRHRQYRPAKMRGIPSLHQQRRLQWAISHICTLTVLPTKLVANASSTTTAVHLMRAVMTTSRPQIARSSEPFALTFAVQGRAVFHSSGRWQPEAIAAGMSSSSMVGIPRGYRDSSR